MTTEKGPSVVCRILSVEEWETAKNTGFVPRRDIDADYYHLSSPDQVIPTANIHFQDATNLIEACFLEESLIEHLKWELAPKRGIEFPHYYADLSMKHVVTARWMYRADGVWHYDLERGPKW